MKCFWLNYIFASSIRFLFVLKNGKSGVFEGKNEVETIVFNKFYYNFMSVDHLTSSKCISCLLKYVKSLFLNT